jgi:hypothetical protein
VSSGSWYGSGSSQVVGERYAKREESSEGLRGVGRARRARSERFIRKRESRKDVMRRGVRMIWERLEVNFRYVWRVECLGWGDLSHIYRSYRVIVSCMG